jgi:hypothetical protein
MKIYIKIVGILLLLLTLNSPLSTARALTTAFTYQGRLNDSNAPANGSYDIAFTLYATNTTGSAVSGPILNTNVIVTNGLFTTAVDFGPGVFTGTNYWLELAVSTNGANAFSTLAPRQALTPTPYATFAAGANAAGLSGTIPTGNVSGTYGSPVNFSNGQNNFDGTFSGLFFGTSFVGGSFVGNGSALMGMWHTMGDFGTTPAQNYLGTADNQPLIIKVNGQQAFEFLPAPTPNIIGGSAFNSLNAGLAYGVTISGGGEAAFPNRVQATYNATYTTIAGGADNIISGSNSMHSVIGGGSFNSIVATGEVIQSTIAGGTQNYIQSSDATVSGGQGNTIGSNSTYAAIGGGYINKIGTNMPYSFIGGGQDNSVSYDLTNPPIGFTGAATVAGGSINQATGILSFVGGGIGNNASGVGSAVLGGNVYQYANSNGTVYYLPGVGAKGVSSTVVGGMGNQAVGDFSLAAGYVAYANHSGTFVWADSQFPTLSAFSSTTSNEFSIRAQNGVRIVADKGVHLNAANEPVIVRDWDVFASNAPAAKAGIGRWGMFIEPYNLTLGIPDTNTGDNLPRYFQVASYATNGAYTPLMVVDQSGNVTATGSINGSGTGLTNVNAVTLGGIPSTGFWKTTGNAGTSPGANFIGTTDGASLQLKAPFVGVGRTTPITGSDVFSMDAPAGPGGFGGMYINTPNTSADPFYGYALGGFYAAYHYVDGSDTNKWKLVTGGSGGFGGTVRLTVMATGNVGIGTTTPDSLLTVNGTADKPGGGSWNTLSDVRLKDIGTNFTHGLESLENIQPVNYHYKKDNPMNLPSQPEYVGVIAQQVQAAIPEAVHPNGSGYLTVNNDPIIWTMVNAIKELNHKVDEKDAENAELKQQLASLEAQVRQLARERGK